MSMRLRALWSMVFWIAVGAGSYALGVQSSVGQRAEASVLDAAEFTTDPPPPLNLVSETSLVIALIVIGAIALAAHGWRRALGVVCVSAAAVVASQLLKLMLSRPELLELDAPNTFPSGHMTVFTVLTAALIWAVPARARALVALGGAVLLAIVAWQLLAYGWHRPSDVLGALALGIASFAAAGVIRPLRRKRPAVLGRSISVGLVMSAWVIIAAALVLAALAAANASSTLMLNAGEFGAVGASALAARSILRLSPSQ